MQLHGLMQAHDDRNLARRLTPAEKKEKKHQKLVGQASETDAPTVHVYRVQGLADPRHRFKVRANAEVGVVPQLVQLRLTSQCLLYECCILWPSLGVQSTSRHAEELQMLQQQHPMPARHRKLISTRMAGRHAGIGLLVRHRLAALSKPCCVQELHLTGCAVIANGSFAVVVVEGGPKAHKFYKKLMLKRIKWHVTVESEKARADGEDGEEEPAAEQEEGDLSWPEAGIHEY